MGVTENNTDLGGTCTLLGELADLVDYLLGGGLDPRGRGARVGDRGGRNALSVAVKTTHVGGCVLSIGCIENRGCEVVTYFCFSVPQKGILLWADGISSLN